MLPYDPVIQTLITDKRCQIDVLRLDLLHPTIGGNKWFKLKHNLQKAKVQGHSHIVTFGGAFSNHIAAAAAACKELGFQSTGVIRGDETETLNPTLLQAKTKGMQLRFVSREEYARKNTTGFAEELTRRLGAHYLIPEGGNNTEGVLGCMDILKPGFDHAYIVCACGTATTFAGILASAQPHQKVIGISVLKGENQLPADARRLLTLVFPDGDQAVAGNEALNSSSVSESCIINAYAFNGYAKFNTQLLEFKNGFEKQFGIPLDHVYTAKLFYGVFDLLKQDKFRSASRMLVIHSGGLQGNAGFEARYPGAKAL